MARPACGDPGIGGQIHLRTTLASVDSKASHTGAGASSIISIVERGLPDPDRLGDLPRRGRGVPLAGEQTSGGFKNLLAWRPSELSTHKTRPSGPSTTRTDAWC